MISTYREIVPGKINVATGCVTGTALMAIPVILSTDLTHAEKTGKSRDCRLKFAGEHLIALLECSRRALGEQFKEFTIEHC